MRRVSFTLFIDIKSEGKSAYDELSKLLKNYDDVLSGMVMEYGRREG